MSADFAAHSGHHLASARNNYVRYGTVAMAFHWTIAALVLTNIVLGIWFVNFLDRTDAVRPIVINWHESIGATVLVLSILRLAWRLMNPIPALPADFSPAKRAFAHGTHYTLYALMILVPLAGWSLASVPARPLVLFGSVPWPKIFLFAGLAPDAAKATGGTLALTHIILAVLLLLLALGHASAAIFYHYMIRKDQILQRMVPGTEVTQAGVQGPVA
ncbi:MAG: cytochrome b [Pseudomonadota bacterium]